MEGGCRSLLKLVSEIRLEGLNKYKIMLNPIAGDWDEEIYYNITQSVLFLLPDNCPFTEWKLLAWM
jgi:hypothetical protein